MQTRFIKEIHVLMRNLNKYLDNQVQFAHIDEANLRDIQINISPKQGPYSGGSFRFGIRIPTAYPYTHPEVVCLSEIYHPNIETDVTDEHNICLNLFDEWTPSFGLLDVIHGLLYLLENPNLDDYISSLFDGSETGDSFTVDVKRSLRGEPFANGLRFLPNDAFLANERSQSELTFTTGQSSVQDQPQVNNTEESGELSRREGSDVAVDSQQANGQGSRDQPSESGNGTALKVRHSLWTDGTERSSVSVEPSAATAIESFIADTNDALMSLPSNSNSKRSSAVSEHSVELQTVNIPATNDSESADTASDTNDDAKDECEADADADMEMSEGEIEAVLNARATELAGGECVAPRFDVSETQRQRFERRRNYLISDSQTLVDDDALLDFLDEYEMNSDEDDDQDASDAKSDWSSNARDDDPVARLPSQPPKGLASLAFSSFCAACGALADEAVRDDALHAHPFGTEFGLLCNLLCLVARNLPISRLIPAVGATAAQTRKVGAQQQTRVTRDYFELECSDSDSDDDTDAMVSRPNENQNGSDSVESSYGMPQLVSIRQLPEDYPPN